MRKLLILLLFPLFVNAQVYEYNGALISFDGSLVTIQNGGFSPLQYTPIAWYDSQDVSTITKDGSNYVSQWNDKSGNNYHLTQGTGANQPLYSATNGIVFDGANDFMVNTFGTTYNNNFTIFVVTEMSVNDFNYILCNNSIRTSNQLFRYTDGNIYHTIAPTYQNYFARTLPFKSIITVKNTSTTNVLYENNTLKSSIVSTSNIFEGLNVGIDEIANTLTSLNGSIEEIIIYNSALTTEQIEIVNAYLNTKYTIY